MSKLQIIIGSTRPERAADVVVQWIVAEATTREDFDIEVVDLRDWPLPMFAEVSRTFDLNNPIYSDPIVGAWNDKIKEGDAYIVVTPEYNHSIPGVLKNAIDSVFASFALRNKPISAVGYSGGIGAAIRAIEHLAHIAIEAEAVPLRNTVLIPYVGNAFGEAGIAPSNPMTKIALDIMLDDLAWWSKVLKDARARGELPPGTFRTRAARRALNG